MLKHLIPANRVTIFGILWLGLVHIHRREGRGLSEAFVWKVAFLQYEHNKRKTKMEILIWEIKTAMGLEFYRLGMFITFI